jgi:hypothetical protein
MGFANRRDHRGAIGEYTSAIDMKSVPADVKAMALFNRALAHSAAGDDKCSVQDLKAVLSMAGAPQNVMRRARQKLAKRELRLRQNKV